MEDGEALKSDLNFSNYGGNVKVCMLSLNSFIWSERGKAEHLVHFLRKHSKSPYKGFPLFIH